LVFSGHYLVKGGVDIAKHFKISTMVAGLTIVAFGTSAPEFIVSMNAALSGNAVISIGNVVGSNIVNIAFILGLTALIIPIPVGRMYVKVDWPVMMGAAVVFYLFVLNDVLEWWEGAILFTAIVVYVVLMVRHSKKEIKNSKEVEKVEPPKYNIGITILIIIAACAGLAFGADWFVQGASSIATTLGVSERIISVTIVAIGTSLPELTASFIAALKKEADISVGNIIGSNIFNILAILGITSMIQEISFDHIPFTFDIITMLVVSIALFFFIYPFKTVYLNRYEGGILMLMYGAYIYLLLTGFSFNF